VAVATAKTKSAGNGEADVVAIFNTSEDTTDLLRITLESAGFVVVSSFTNWIRDSKTDLEAFMRQHRPRVVVYDIALPYDQNWRLFQKIRKAPACRGISFVLTTTNVAQVQRVAGSEQHVHEIVGKPYDLDIVVRAVKEAARSRSTH
jgi:DNA-binding response OmpR family regulator